VTSFAAALYLHTAPFIAAAIALYEGLGYRRDPATDIDIGAHFGVAPSGSAIIRAYRLGLAPAVAWGRPGSATKATPLTCPVGQPIYALPRSSGLSNGPGRGRPGLYHRPVAVCRAMVLVAASGSSPRPLQSQQRHQPRVRHQIVLVEARRASGEPVGDSH
jgi:hypothetical protein